MPKRNRRIKKARITSIALCARGKNRCTTLYKAEDGAEPVELTVLSKKAANFDEQGELLCVVWPSNVPDTDGDWSDDRVTKSMAHGAMRDGVSIDIEHDGQALGPDQAFLAESFIIQKSDERFRDWKDYDGNPVDTEGAWGGVLKIDDPGLRARVKSGELNGVSIEGPAILTNEAPLAKSETGLLSKLVGMLTKAMGVGHQEDEDMKPEEVKTLVNETLVAAGLVKSEKPGGGGGGLPEGVDPNDAASLEAHAAKLRKAAAVKDLDVDFSDPDAVEKHARALRVQALMKKHDLTTQEGIEAYSEELKKTAAGESTDTGDEDPEVKELKAKLAKAEARVKKAQKKSKQPDGEGGNEMDDEFSHLEKSEADSIRLGLSMGKQISGVFGYSSEKKGA